jgi:3-deoxy-D-manno-octulosonic acid kinase
MSAAVACLPAGYATGRERGVEYVALPSVVAPLAAALREAGTLYDWAAAQPDARAFTGRGRAYGVDTAAGTWVVRHYRRGGLVAPLLGDRYLRLGAARPLRELAASAAAQARGVPTPEVVAALVYAAGPLYRADLATRYVPASADLAETVLGGGRADAAGRLAAWSAAGALLRTAFDAGVEHADLNLRNILVSQAETGPRALLLDLDRAAVRDAGLGDVVRSRLLARLHRSRRKLESALGQRASAAELAAFTAAVEGRVG